MAERSEGESQQQEEAEASETPIYEAVRWHRGDDKLVSQETSLVTLTYRRRDLEETLAEAGEQTARPEGSITDAPGNHVEIDEMYFDEVRKAVGGGAPTVLLGTSTKALERNLEKLRDLQPSKATQPKTRPQHKSPSKSQPESGRAPRPRRATQSEPASRTAIRIWEAVKFVVWLFGGLTILGIVTAPSKAWSDFWTALALIVDAAFILPLSVIVYVRRHAAERWVDRQLVMIREQIRKHRDRGRESTGEHPDEKAEWKKR